MFSIFEHFPYRQVFQIFFQPVFSFRQCIGGEAGIDCPGSRDEQITCNGQACESWGQWSDFNRCSVSCGGGIKTRMRTCVGGLPDDPGCRGPKSEVSW